MRRQAQADIKHLRQSTQYTCVAASITSCLMAHGKDVSEEDVNHVLGASPMRGASWEQALATIQYFGLRGHMVVPCTIPMLREWTDAGTPVIIAWNPEGRPWSHASVVFHVDDTHVHVIDSHCPDPAQTTRIVPHAEFYGKWMEQFSDSILIRHPALAVEREITPEGRQVRANQRNTAMTTNAKGPTKADPARDPYARERGTRNWGAGGHQTRDHDVETGRSRKPKHKNRELEGSYSGNPDGKPIYPNEIDHGYEEPIGGGFDIMQDLNDDLVHEQGRSASAHRVASWCLEDLND